MRRAARAEARRGPTVRRIRRRDRRSRAPAVPRVATALAAPQIARIQAQAEQKLRHRGLLRVSSADRWGVTLETAPSGEVVLAGVLRDLALYDEAVRLVREVPGVKAVRG